MSGHPRPPAAEVSEFIGQVALVTGAAGGGIGETTARRLAAGGATVVVTDCHEARAEKAASKISLEFGRPAHHFPLDVTRREAIRSVVEQVGVEVGPISILVNNAAINIFGSIFEYTEANWDTMMEANLTAPWLLSRAVMIGMRDRGTGGVIINLSSDAADFPSDTKIPYAVTKAALNALTRNCAFEGGPYGIRCNAVSMDSVRGTRMIERLLQSSPDREPKGPLGDWVWPADIAEAIAFLASDRARMITGHILDVTAGSFMRT